MHFLEAWYTAFINDCHCPMKTDFFTYVIRKLHMKNILNLQVTAI